MSKTESLSKDEIFPFLVCSNSLNVVPPAPDDRVCSRIYERVLSCLPLSTRPGSMSHLDKDERTVGDLNLDDSSYQLSHMAVHIVSQLQSVEKDKTYDDAIYNLERIRKAILIFGSRNATLVGLMGVFCQLERTSSQHRDMLVQRTMSIESGELIGEPLPPAEEYRFRCTRFLIIEIIRILKRYVQKFMELGIQAANEGIYMSAVWTSESFKVMVWEALANIGLLSNNLFITSSIHFWRHTLPTLPVIVQR